MAEEVLSQDPLIEFTQGKKFTDEARLTFDQIKRGSELLVYTSLEPENLKPTPDYKIRVFGKRKEGLLVEVSIFGPRPEQFTARMPGGLRGNETDSIRAALKTGTLGYELGITPGVIGITNENEDYKLHFENLKYLSGPFKAGSGFTAKFSGRGGSLTSTLIRKILFKK